MKQLQVEPQLFFSVSTKPRKQPHCLGVHFMRYHLLFLSKSRLLFWGGALAKRLCKALPVDMQSSQNEKLEKCG